MSSNKRTSEGSGPSQTSKRRKRNEIICGGQCGNSMCTFVSEYRKNLDKHLGKDKTQCPVCNKWYSEKTNMYKHFRKFHPHLMEVHNIPNRNNLTCPEHLKKYKVEFDYLKEKVRKSMLTDTTKLKKMKEYVKTKRGPKYEEYKQIIPHYELMVENTNEIRHDIATQWIERLIDTNRIGTPFMHESGLRMEYVFQEHGGLFQISMDRIDDDFPHFYGEEYAFNNIRDVPLSMNLQYNPLDYCIKRNFVEEVVYRVHNPISVDTTTLTLCDTVFYNSAASAYDRDKQLLINKFSKRKHYVKYCFELAEKQGYKCALSGIRPINGKPSKIKGIDKIFQWSLNAIDPTKGHIPGNIEWVCYCFNPINRDKDKKIHYDDDHPAAWTKELFKEYFLNKF